MSRQQVKDDGKFMISTWPQPTVLTYHEILPEVHSSRYTSSCAQFAEHLRLITALQTGQGVSTKVTFDDGHRSNWEYALPLLREYKIQATFFITAGWISKRITSMEWPQVHQLIAEGHSIQAHGWSHRFLSECSDKELWHELHYAKTFLEDHVGQEVPAVSMPGGRVDERVLYCAARAGYKQLYVSTPWTCIQPFPGFQVTGRIMVRRTMRSAAINALIRQTTAARTSVRVEHATKSLAKLVAGGRLYHFLWSRAAGRDRVSSSGDIFAP